MLLKTKISHVSEVLLALPSLSFEEHLAVLYCHSSLANPFFSHPCENRIVFLQVLIAP